MYNYIKKLPQSHITNEITERFEHWAPSNAAAPSIQCLDATARGILTSLTYGEFGIPSSVDAPLTIVRPASARHKKLPCFCDANNFFVSALNKMNFAYCPIIHVFLFQISKKCVKIFLHIFLKTFWVNFFQTTTPSYLSWIPVLHAILSTALHVSITFNCFRSQYFTFPCFIL